MPPIKTLMLLVPLSVLTACVGSTPSIKVAPVAPIHLVRPDTALTKDCDDPVNLGTSPLQQAQGEKFWATDRGALVSCKRGKRALVQFYAKRDAALEAATK